MTRILVIDDDPIEARLLQAIFRPLTEFELEIATDGETGVSRLDTTPDLVLLDVMLPGISGIDTLRLLKKKRPDLPVIMLTAHSEIPAVVEAIQLGAHNYLTKPVNGDELVATVQRALEQRELAGGLGS